MQATFTLTEDELNLKFLDTLRKMMNGGTIRLTVDFFDETDYLMSSPKNKKILIKRLKDIDNGIELVNFSETEFKSMV
ncbi:MAG: hypothetical protein HW421_2492 [Ignavibacteria bacterium]|nr:hypothetical protein [Ignavibacteria bacterium]